MGADKRQKDERGMDGQRTRERGGKERETVRERERRKEGGGEV